MARPAGLIIFPAVLLLALAVGAAPGAYADALDGAGGDAFPTPQAPVLLRGPDTGGIATGVEGSRTDGGIGALDDPAATAGAFSPPAFDSDPSASDAVLVGAAPFGSTILPDSQNSASNGWGIGSWRIRRAGDAVPWLLSIFGIGLIATVFATRRRRGRAIA